MATISRTGSSDDLRTTSEYVALVGVPVTCDENEDMEGDDAGDDDDDDDDEVPVEDDFGAP